MPESVSTPHAERELSGGTVIWIFVAIELLTFALFFFGFAAARRADPATFIAGLFMEMHRGPRAWAAVMSGFLIAEAALILVILP